MNTSGQILETQAHVSLFNVRLQDTDPDYLSVLADCLESGGFYDLSKEFRDAKPRVREYIVQGWVRPSTSCKVVHWVEKDRKYTICGVEVLDWYRWKPSHKLKKCKFCERKLQGG